MLSQEIERRLRLPAPDEPRFLPALVLPTLADDLGIVRGRVRLREGPGRRGVLSPRLVIAIAALLVALVGAVVSGAIRLEFLRSLFDATTTFQGRGLTLTYPRGWQVVAALNDANDQGAWTTLIVSSRGVDGCSAADVGTQAPQGPVPSGGEVEPVDQTGMIFAVEDRIFACVVAAPMAEGEIRLVLTRGYPQRIAIGPIEPFDAQAWFGEGASLGDGPGYVPNEADGWTDRVDGMPAKLVIESTSIVPAADEVRTWGIYPPGGSFELWYVRATLRGPNLDALRAQADAVARSIRFDIHPVPLDIATRDIALATVLDGLDRETRQWKGSDLYGCFPRTPGSAPAMLIDLLHDYGPDGRLAEPVPVTCTTSVEPTPLETWLATLTISWEAGDGYSAGEWGWFMTFDSLGSAAGVQGQLLDPAQFEAPGSVGELPPPLEGPFVIPVGSIVEVRPPGVLQDSAPIQAIFSNPNATIGDRVAIDAQPGRRFGVIDGPISHAGFDWYLVQPHVGTAYPSEYVWIPSSDGVRPLLSIDAPACPVDGLSVVELAQMHPLEAVLCYGSQELTLGPVVAGRGQDDGNMNEVDATPGWLGRYSDWRLYPPAGPLGVYGGLPIAIDPSLGDTLPTGTQLTVRGHFDDPAAEGCERTYPDAWNLPPQPHEIAVLECRELFVVTSIEVRTAP